MLEFELTTPMICNFFFRHFTDCRWKIVLSRKKSFHFYSISVEIFYRMTTNDLLNRSNNHSLTIFFFRRKIEMCCHFLYFDFWKVPFGIETACLKKMLPLYLAPLFSSKYRNSFHNFFWTKTNFDTVLSNLVTFWNARYQFAWVSVNDT